VSAQPSVPAEASLEAGGHVKGLAIAIVRQNKDDSGQASVRVSYPWHSRPRESYPARIAVPMAGSNRGTYFVPEIGDEVLVGFDRGDLRHPYVVGCLWNGADPSPEKNADGRNDRRVIRSRKGHELAFDDGERGSVRLQLNDGKRLLIDDDQVTLDDGKGNRLEIRTNDGSVTLESIGTLTLKGASVSIQATGSLDLKSGATASLSGTLVRIN